MTGINSTRNKLTGNNRTRKKHDRKKAERNDQENQRNLTGINRTGKVKTQKLTGPKKFFHNCLKPGLLCLLIFSLTQKFVFTIFNEKFRGKHVRNIFRNLFLYFFKDVIDFAFTFPCRHVYSQST